MSVKTTKKHFRLFKKEAKKWIGRFGLIGWEIDYCHDDGDEHLAACYSSCENRSALLELKKDWPDNEGVDDQAIRLAAFHEVCELFMARLIELSKDRFAPENSIEIEKHAIIRTLENVLFRKDKR